MRYVSLYVLLVALSCSPLLADTQDTAVFRTALRTDAEVPPVNVEGVSGNATITVNVTRDTRGNVDSASVTFEVDYTVSVATTFTGLHIHNAPAGSNGSVVINTGLSASSPVVAAAGSGRITRTVNYTSSDVTGLRYVTGLLAQAELYYVNLHSTTSATGLIRGQLFRNRVIFRPVMSSAFEVPAVALDAEGAAAVEVTVNRDANGVITSGAVAFDVDYRLPGSATITGLHIHNAPFGVNAGVVIDTGINGTTRSVATSGRGNIFRVAEINSSNTTGIAALNGLMNDPTQYYINLHTSANATGVIRGQLSPNVFVFFNQMSPAEENPAVLTEATGNAMTYIRLDRDSTGNVVAGAVSFNVNHSMGAPTTFTGLHIHNARLGTNGGVVIDTGITGTNPVVDSDGVGSINREVAIDASSTTVAFDSLRAIVDNPEGYYVNLHTSTHVGGMIRAQLVRETYRFRTNMSPANEVPPVTSDASATGWISVKVGRDGSGVVNGGVVTFDVNYVTTGPTTFTGLHIHHPARAGANASVTINTGISASAPVESATGSGNITRVVTVSPTDANGIATLNTLISNPDNAYINLHTSTNGTGFLRSQMLPVAQTVAQTAGGGDWISSITVTNPSTTAGVQGIVNFYQSSGAAVPGSISDPNRSFWIPPSGSATFNVNNKGTLTAGFARIFSGTPVTVDVAYHHPAYTTTGRSTTTTARAVSIPVVFSSASGNPRNTGVALVVHTPGNLVLSLVDGAGDPFVGGSGSVTVTAGQHIVGFVRDLLPGLPTLGFNGTLVITANATTGVGELSAMALQFNGTLATVTVTTLP